VNTHYTQLINVSKDKEGCIRKEREFNTVRLQGKGEAAQELLLQLRMQIRMPRPRVPLLPGKQPGAGSPPRW